MRKILCYSFFYLFTIISFYFLNYLQFEFMEPMAPQFFSGMITGESSGINIFYFLAYYGLSDFFVFMYKWDYYFPWYEVIWLFLFGIGFVSFFNNFDKLIKNWVLSHRLCVLTILFSCSLLLLVPLQYTKLSFILCFSGISIFFNNQTSSFSQIIFHSLLFLLGTLVRFEMGILVFILYVLIFLFLEVKLNKNQLFYLAFTGLIVFIISMMISREIANSKEYNIRLEPTLAYQLLDRKNIVPLEGISNSKDRAKYIAFQNSISDPKEITIEFLESLVKDNPYYGLDKEFFKRANGIFYNSLKDSFYFVIIYLLSFILLIIKNKNRRLRLLLFNLLFISFVYLICYLIKMEIWLFQCLIFAILTMNILLNKDGFLTPIFTRRNLMFPLFFLILIQLSLLLNDLRLRTVFYESKLNESKLFVSIVEKKLSGKIIVPDISLFFNILYSHGLFDQSKPFLFGIVLLDQDVLFWEKNYNEVIQKKFNLNTIGLKSVFRDLSKRDDVIFLFKESRMINYINYLRDGLGELYNFENIGVIKWNNVNYFLLKLKYEGTIN